MDVLSKKLKIWAHREGGIQHWNISPGILRDIWKGEYLMTKTAYSGVWTPRAEVLCPKCHGGEQLTLREVGENERITRCDECGVEIAVDKTVALEHNLMFFLQDKGIPAHMVQTGGMASAVWIHFQHANGELYYFAIVDRYFWEGEEGFLVSVNTVDGEMIDCTDSSIKTPNDVYNWISKYPVARFLPAEEDTRR